MPHYKILKFNEHCLSLLVGILIFLDPYFDWDFLKILFFFKLVIDDSSELFLVVLK